MRPMTASEQHRDRWLIVSMKRLLGGGHFVDAAGAAGSHKKANTFQTLAHSCILRYTAGTGRVGPGGKYRAVQGLREGTYSSTPCLRTTVGTQEADGQAD